VADPCTKRRRAVSTAIDRVKARIVLYPFAVRATVPLARYFGPFQIEAGDMRAVRRIARRSLAAIDRLGAHLRGPEAVEAVNAGSSQLLHAFAREISTLVHADEPAILDWMTRQELDPHLRNGLHDWASSFIRVGADLRMGSLVPRPEIRRIDLFTHSLSETFWAGRVEASGLLRLAEAEPSDTKEQRLLAMEQSQVGDAAIWDVVEWVEIAINVEAAYRVLGEILPFTDARDRKALIEWAVRFHSPDDRSLATDLARPLIMLQPR